MHGGSSLGGHSSNYQTAYPDIRVPKYTTSKKNKRNHKKLHCCDLCQKVMQKLPRHFELLHANEPEIAKILASTDKKESEKELEKIRLRGDFHHNIDLYEAQKGQLLVLRKSKLDRIAEDYLPCTYCLGFVYVGELWRHVRNCPFRDSINETQCESETIVSQCRMLLHGGIQKHQAW